GGGGGAGPGAGVVGDDAGWTALLGTDTTDYGNDIAIDPIGNVVVVGDTFGSVNGDALQGSQDMFIAMYDPDGILLWSDQIGSSDFDRYFGVSIDNSDDIYAIGSSSGSLGATNLGGNDIILTKYDSAGNLLWVNQLGTTGSDHGYSVSADSLGNVYICGETTGSFGASNTTFNSDAFVAKLDTDGNTLWIDQFSSSFQLGDGEDCRDIAVDLYDHVYVTGYTPGALVEGASGAEFYVRKYASDGNVEWTTQRDSIYANEANSIAVDPAGNAYVAGTGGLDAAVSGLEDAFIVKFDATGVEQWAELLQSTGQESLNGVDVDDAGNVFVAGFTVGSLAAANDGDTDIIFARYDTNGNLLSVIQNATTSWDRANGVAVDATGSDYYLVGNTDGDLDGELNNGAYDLFATRNRP
ncbi:MAG: SBBP repeat-containing protein, partial [Pseudomonadota bacterium]